MFPPVLRRPVPPSGRRLRKPGAAPADPLRPAVCPTAWLTGHRFAQALALALVLTLAIAATVRPARAQNHQIALEANPFHGTVSYGWAAGPDRVVGVEFGIGFPELDRTLVPGEDTLVDFAHLGVFLRTRPASSITFDRRVQLGLAELDGCSGCLPGLLAAVSAGVFWGGRHVRVGPRLTAGVIAEMGNPAAAVVNLTPFAVLVSYAW